MLTWILAQTTAPQESILIRLIEAAFNNPQLALFAISLLVFYFVTRGWTQELAQSRKMLNDSQRAVNEQQKAGDLQENKALDMATNAINKLDRVADSITDMAQSMRQSSADYFASAQLNTDAHIKQTNMLVQRIEAMDNKRAEDEMYSNGKLLVQIDEQLNKHKEDVGKLVGTILGEAQTLHEETRRVFHAHNELILEALRATPALSPPADKSDSQTQ